MIKIKKKLFFFSFSEIWFEYKFRIRDLIFPAVYKDIRNPDQKFYLGYHNKDYSVELDLDQPVENILSSFRSRIKSELRRAEKEGVKCYFDDDLDKFMQFYNDFSIRKKIKPVTKMRLTEMADHFKICYAELDGNILAAHSYLVDKEFGMVMQFHSASTRFNENADRSQIARANKLLQVFGMLSFKEQGIKIYDFGAYNVGEGTKGLLEFKKSLGGKEVTRTYFMTYSFYLIHKLQNLVQSFRK